MLRRAEVANQHPVKIVAGDLEIGIEEGVVTLDGVPLALTRTEFRLLAELAGADGRCAPVSTCWRPSGDTGTSATAGWSTCMYGAAADQG